MEDERPPVLGRLEGSERYGHLESRGSGKSGDRTRASAYLATPHMISV